MNLKKIICAALCGVMAVSMVSSCGSKKENRMDKDKLTGPKAYEEQIELKIPVYEEVCRDRQM